ncbi:DUF1853 family protein [Saccharospirillum mangrovi]|uniref:DUF1853 family protein n=1 Tax=Saccharospirillum mangrovi TaxID=2161747 RepID=UPI0013003BB8|nr:DUF1853 family protein [Saccharospirillum mangrovi]
MNEAAHPLPSAALRADLDWVQHSPALLADPALAWRPVLGNNPLSKALPDATLADLEQRRQSRLGPYFEALAAALLTASGQYRILAQNRVISVPQRTLGELDLLVEDRRTGECLHLELALKFYLRLPELEGLNPDYLWIGAGLRDFLALKAQRLKRHQRRLPELARQHDAWPADLPFPQRSEVWALGRGFVPFDAPIATRSPLSDQTSLGHWLTLSDFQHHSFTGQWVNKANWLADRDREAHTGLRHPLPGQFFGRLDNGPAQHWFVVPDDWPAAAQARILQRFATSETES